MIISAVDKKNEFVIRYRDDNNERQEYTIDYTMKRMGPKLLMVDH